MTTAVAPNLNRWDQRHLAAVEAAGFEPTLKVIETFLGSFPDQARFGRAVRHPAFQLLDADYQAAIRDRHDEKQLRWFVRKLLSMLSVSQGLGMINGKASPDVWRARISELRNAERPQPHRPTSEERRQCASQRAARRQARSKAGPKKGNNPQPPKFGAARKK